MLGSVNKAITPDKKAPSFGNGLLMRTLGGRALTGAFTFLEQNPAMEIIGIDIATMVAPRVYVDYKQNPVYGREAIFREATAVSTLVFAPGIIGATAMLAKGLKGLYTDSNTLKTLHRAWEQAGGNIDKYVTTVLENTEAVVGEKPDVKLKPEDIKKISRRISKTIRLDDKYAEKLNKKTVEKCIKATQAAGNISVKIGDRTFSNNIEGIIRDVVAAPKKVFMKNKNVDKLCGFLKNKSVLATAGSFALGFSLHYINEAITKKKTGRNDFTGYKDFCDKKQTNKQKEPSYAPLWKRLLATAGLGAITLFTMGGFKKGKGFFKPGDWKKGWNNFVKAVELKGPYPNMNLMKLVLGAELTGRFMVARDETELKVSTIRDYGTFFNLLVVGPLITKGLLQAVGPEMINGKVKKGFKKLLNCFGDKISTKTISEIKAMPGTKAQYIFRMAKYNGCKAVSLGWQLFALGIGMSHFLNKYIIDGTNKGNEKNSNKITTIKTINSFTSFIDKNKEVYKNFGGMTSNA